MYTAGGKRIQAVEDAAWQLVQISSDLSDAKCAAFTSELLAAIGPFPSGAVMHRQLATSTSVPEMPAGLMAPPASGGRKSSGMHHHVPNVNLTIVLVCVLQLKQWPDDMLDCSLCNHLVWSSMVCNSQCVVARDSWP